MTYFFSPYSFTLTRHLVTPVDSYSLNKLDSHSKSPIIHLPHSEKKLTDYCPFFCICTYFWLRNKLRFYSPSIEIPEISIQVREVLGCYNKWFLLSLKTFKRKKSVDVVRKPKVQPCTGYRDRLWKGQEKSSGFLCISHYRRQTFIWWLPSGQGAGDRELNVTVSAL